MHVTYDHSILLAGIGVAPWTRLGLERWFDNYRIVALHDTDAAGLAHMPPINLLGDVQLTKQNTQQIVRSDAFLQLAHDELAGYDFSIYRPVQVDNPALLQRCIMSNPEYSLTYENKAWFRQQLGGQLPFAPFTIYTRPQLQPTAAGYAALGAIGMPFVMQHEQLSGGKGTYLIRSYQDYLAALQALPEVGDIVVSQLIDGARERSVQCCVTKSGTVCGPLQKQIVRNPALCNLEIPAVNGFVGGEIGTVTASPEIQETVQWIANIVGAHMAASGYKGIFGIDFLIRGQEIFVLEVNARLTGLTPLLTMMCRPETDIPFYLLHTLELGGYDYAVSLNNQPASQAKGSLLVLQSQQPVPTKITKTIASGIYAFESGELRLVRRDCAFAETDPASTVCVQQYAGVGETVKPGARIVACMTRTPVLDENDELTREAGRLIEQVYARITQQSLPS